MMPGFRKIGAGCAVAIALVIAAAAPANAQQTILGKKLVMKAKLGPPNVVKLQADAKEIGSLNTLDGDPQANGASVTVIANGGTSGTQTFNLPSGAAWRRSPSNTAYAAIGWGYKDSRALTSPVTGVKLKAKGGKFQVQVQIYDRATGAFTIVPPNPATYIGIVVTINGAGGDSYCLNYGGAAGGLFAANTAAALKIAKPTSEATCPTGTPTCGDGVIQSPSETCDVGNDAACPGLCGANGLPCLCPYCGDATQDPGEACDGSDLGACTDGCSYACTCTTCGDNVQQSPAEECDGTDDEGCPGLCLPPGGPNQCRCPYCGDDEVNQVSEQCDGSDDSACSGNCISGDCLCAVCGNGVLEAAEVCDPGGPGGDPAPSDDDCPGQCNVDCTCP